MSLTGKIILVTGGTGSFGQKFVEEALSQDPLAIRVFSRGEMLQEEMQKKFKDERLRFLIGDVRDEERLELAMEGVHIVVHAAALKIVPTAEYNPQECVKTNIIGSMNVAYAAIKSGVQQVIGISSDKACHPVNLYGATKSVMERVMIQSNVYSRFRTRISCTRYGNVVGSRGSVVPLFKQQRETGEVTITHPEMTRYWITLDQGVKFVTHCIEAMRGGEIFVPKLPSMKVTDLANAICPNCVQKIIGIRPGEKIHETLVTEDEARHTREFEDYYTIHPEIPIWANMFKDMTGKPVHAAYTSGTNSTWLSIEDLRKIVDAG